MATGTRAISSTAALLRRMPWTGAASSSGAMAISGLPLLNGFAERVADGFRRPVRVPQLDEPLVYFLFPVGGALLALTDGAGRGLFRQGVGISFLRCRGAARPRGTRGAGPVMLAPQACLANAVLGLGLFPAVLRVLGRRLAALPGLQPRADIVRRLAWA